MISILHVNSIQSPKSTYSSYVISLFGMGVVRDNSQTSLDDMEMFSSFRPSEQTGAGAQAPKFDKIVRLFGMGIVHEHHYQVSMEFCWTFRWIYGNV